MAHTCCDVRPSPLACGEYFVPPEEECHKFREGDNNFRPGLESCMCIYAVLPREHLGPFSIFWCDWWTAVNLHFPRESCILKSHSAVRFGTLYMCQTVAVVLVPAVVSVSNLILLYSFCIISSLRYGPGIFDITGLKLGLRIRWMIASVPYQKSCPQGVLNILGGEAGSEEGQTQPHAHPDDDEISSIITRFSACVQSLREDEALVYRQSQ